MVSDQNRPLLCSKPRDPAVCSPRAQLRVRLQGLANRLRTSRHCTMPRLNPPTMRPDALPSLAQIPNTVVAPLYARPPAILLTSPEGEKQLLLGDRIQEPTSQPTDGRICLRGARRLRFEVYGWKLVVLTMAMVVVMVAPCGLMSWLKAGR